MSSGPGCPSTPPGNNRDKQILEPTGTTSLRSPAELVCFKPILSRLKSETDSLPHDRSAPPPSPSLSAIAIGHNEDILTQIFLYLPPKSLIRFQCVCKQWFSLISSPRFRRLHTSQSPTVSPSSSVNTSGLFLYRIIFSNLDLNFLSLRDSESDANSMGIITSRLIDFLIVHGEILHIHGCNGLLCLDFYWNFEVRRLCVYNPTTEQYLLVQWPNIEEKSWKIWGVNILFDPLKPDQYRILCLWSKIYGRLEDLDGGFERLKCLGCNIYSSKTQTWNDTISIELPFLEFYFEHGVFLNGNLYWASMYRSLLFFDAENECIHCLSCGHREFTGKILYFGESMGKLHLIGAVHPQSDILELLEWEENLEFKGWVVKYHVNISSLTTLYPLMEFKSNLFSPPIASRFVVGILCFHVTEGGNGAKLIMSVPGKIISYEVNDMTVEELVDIEPADVEFLWNNMSLYVWEDVYKHIETLACV